MKTIILCLVLLSCVQYKMLEAQCREQKQSEKAVIDKAVKIFEDAFNKPLQAIGWQITEENNGHNTQIAITPDPFRPLFMCSDFFSLKLSLNPNSAYGKLMQDSAEYYNKQVVQYSKQWPMSAADSKALKQATQNLSRVESMQSAEISIDANDPYLKEDYHLGAKDKYTVLHIPGAAYACRIYTAPEDASGSPEEKTKIFFGNWKGANLNAGAYTGYPFVHKKQGPFIENFVVTVNAPSSAADKIIQKIDWDKLNEAISI